MEVDRQDEAIEGEASCSWAVSVLCRVDARRLSVSCPAPFRVLRGQARAPRLPARNPRQSASMSRLYPGAASLICAGA